MLNSVRTVYARQWPVVAGDPAGETAFHRGLTRLTSIFLDCIVENIEDRLRIGDRHRAAKSARLLSEESPERWHALLARDHGFASLLSDLDE
jgi:hypothetical protein